MMFRLNPPTLFIALAFVLGVACGLEPYSVDTASETGGTAVTDGTGTTSTPTTGPTSASTNEGTSGSSGTPEPSVCGDGVVQVGEECDNGDKNFEWGSCTPSCLKARCGDGFVATSEQCDDGNMAEDDACLSTCRVRTCPGCPLVIAAIAPSIYEHWYVNTGDEYFFEPAPIDIRLGLGLLILSDGVGLAVYRVQDSGEVKYQFFKNGAWSAPLTLVSLPGKTWDVAISRNGKGAHLVYRIDSKYFYAAFDGTTWDPVAEPLDVVSPRLGGIAGFGDEAVYVFSEGFDGEELAFASRVRSDGVWQPTQIIDKQTGKWARVMALAGGAELFACSLQFDAQRFSVRKAGVWAPFKPIMGETVVQSLAALPGGGVAALRTEVDIDGSEWGPWRLMFSRYDVDKDSWSTPSLVVEHHNPIGHVQAATGAGDADVEVLCDFDSTGSHSMSHLRLIRGKWEEIGVDGGTGAAFRSFLASSGTP